MTRAPTPEQASLALEMAAAYQPVVRGFLLAAFFYYCLIAASHPFFEKDLALLVLEGLAIVSAIGAFSLWMGVRRGRTGLAGLEAATLVFIALMLANVVAYQLLHFEPLKLVYFVLMALVFATAAPSPRVAILGVLAASAGLVYFAVDAPGDLISQYAFVGLAGAFAAIGMASLMRGVIVREVRARLAGDALNSRLGEELQRNRQLTREAERLAIEAQSANRAKSEFLATISHEIRTPLNGVLGMSQVMEQGALNKPQRARLALIQSSALSLLDIVNDVLDVSKIEAGKMTLNPGPFDLDAFIGGLESLYADLAGRKGLALTCLVEPQAGGWWLGDEAKIRQVLGNLISNALKFTEKGGIDLRVSARADGRLWFSVSDSGVGIPAGDQGLIFDKFFQADGSATRRQGGTGLGLTICRQLVRLMSGEIAFESVEGVGSSFWFSLPLSRADQPDAPPLASGFEAGAEEGVRVLIVDDNATNRLILEQLLANLGVATGSAEDGLQAVEAWRGGDWDAILMDVQMPHMDGLEATRTIRAAEAAARRARTPIIAVTASVLSHETNRYTQAGMDELIAKPISAERLISVLETCLAEPRGAAAAA